MENKTIYALSTVFGKSGVAVIRISGSEVKNIISKVIDLDINKIKPRHAYFINLKDNVTRETIDKCLILYFNAPHSFTGEDVLEIQCHGSKAVLNSVFKNLSNINNVRLAEPGEFSKRAFYNNKMDLTEADGLADLIDAETSEQQKYAIRQMEGNLKNLYYSWREELVRILSYLEAYIDFPEEEISKDLYDNILNTVFKVKSEIKNHLNNNNVNERLKNGFRVVIAGKTNAGKSSLINALTKKNTMIVSDIEGTTRDAVDINLDINGFPIIITDTAGIRNTDNKIEKMGIDIALEKIKTADIIIALYDASKEIFDDNILPSKTKNILYVANKVDKISNDERIKILNKSHFLLSTKSGEGLLEITEKITSIIRDKINPSSNLLITRERYRIYLNECLIMLENFSLEKEIELSAEDIRLACRAIGKITGEVKVDEILDNIFSSFCIGK